MKYLELAKRIKENKEDYISKQDIKRIFKEIYRSYY